MRMVVRALLAGLPLIAAGPPPPSDSPHAACEAAIAVAERAHRIPDKLMPAISRVESGRFDPIARRVRAWPWTINVEGVGSYFDTKDQVIATVRALQARGIRSIDVGCMQVNLMHHPTAFPTLDDAFDPPANARYAAQFLTALRARTGDWNLAAANYHSADPDRGEDYQRRVFGQVMTPMPGARGPTATVKPAGPYAIWPPSGSTYAALPPLEYSFGAFRLTPGPTTGRLIVQIPPSTQKGKRRLPPLPLAGEGRGEGPTRKT